MFVVNEETDQITQTTTSDNVPSACAPRKDSDQPMQADESSLVAFWISKDAKFLHANNKDSDQTTRMRRLISVFVGSMSKGVFSYSLYALKK